MPAASPFSPATTSDVDRTPKATERSWNPSLPSHDYAVEVMYRDMIRSYPF